MAKMKFLKHIEVDADIKLEVWELPSGGIVGLDCNLIDQMDEMALWDPYFGNRIPLSQIPRPKGGEPNEAS